MQNAKSKKMAHSQKKLSCRLEDTSSAACVSFHQNGTLKNLTFYMRKQLLLSVRLSHRNSVSLSVHPSVTQMDQSKTMQARITKSLPSAAWKTLVSETVKLFHKFVGGHPKQRRKMRKGRKNLRFLANKSLYLSNGVR